MEISRDEMREDHCFSQYPRSHTQEGTRYIYYCGDDNGCARLVRELHWPPEEECSFTHPCTDQHFRGEARLLGGAERHTCDTSESHPNYQVDVVGGEEIASNALEIIKVVDELLNQATCLKKRLVVMLTNFQTKVCKCSERHSPCEVGAKDNDKLDCECSFHIDPERTRGGGSLPDALTNLSHKDTKDKLSPEPRKLSMNKITPRNVNNDKEQKPSEKAAQAPMTSAMSVAVMRSSAELDLRLPSNDPKSGKNKTRLGAGHASAFPSAVTLHRKEHEVVQLRDVSRQLLNIQQEIQVLREQVAKLSCQTACHMTTVDTSDNENLLEEIMSSNLIGKADEIKQTLTEIKSDCYQKLSPSSDILPRLGEKKVHEKIEREIKRSHPDFSRTINQVKLTTGEKILDKNMQHTTFDQTCETNIDTHRRDGSASKNMAFKVMKKTDEKIHNPYSEDERRETLKQSKKLITTEDKAINEEDTINEQQINSADKRTIATHRYVTRTEQVVGREPLKEVLLNVQINRTIDNKTGEVVETMQELNPEASQPIAYNKQNERGITLSMQPTELQKPGPFRNINERSHLTNGRSKAGSAAWSALQSTKCSNGPCELPSKVASYFEVLADEFKTDGQEIGQSARGEWNDNTSAAMESVYDDGRTHYESLRSKGGEIEAKSGFDHGWQMELSSVEHFEPQSSPKYDEKSRFDMDSRKSKQMHPTNIFSEKCIRYAEDVELPPNERRCIETIEEVERNEEERGINEDFRFHNDQRSSRGAQSISGKRHESVYHPSNHSAQHQEPEMHTDAKSQHRIEVGGHTPSGRSYRTASDSQNQSYSAKSNATDGLSLLTGDTRATSHKTGLTRRGDDEQSKYDEVRSFKPRSEKLSQIEDNVTQYSANRSRSDGARSVYSHRYSQDRNDNEEKSHKSKFGPASEWQSNTTGYHSEIKSDNLSPTRAHSEEQHGDEKSRASNRLERIVIDPGTDQSLGISIAGTSHYTASPRSSPVAEEGTYNGPYFYKVQSELKLLTDSKLDRICATRANQRILAGANNPPREPPKFDDNDNNKQRSEAESKQESHRSHYKPGMPMKAAAGNVKSNLKLNKRPFASVGLDQTLASQAAQKLLAVKSHITIDPKFYYSETAAEPTVLNDRIASQSNFDAVKSELSSQNLSSEKNSELLIKQDLRGATSEATQQGRAGSQQVPSNLIRFTENSRKTRLSGGKNPALQDNGQEAYENDPTNHMISQAEASSGCSPLIKSVRIDCIPRVIDELSGRRCPNDFFISVVPNKEDGKTFRVNIIDKQNGDILGYFLIDEEKFQQARDQGLFDHFLTLYVLNSTASAGNLENHTTLKADNQHMCRDQCPCHGKHRSTMQS